MRKERRKHKNLRGKKQKAKALLTEGRQRQRLHSDSTLEETKREDIHQRLSQDTKLQCRSPQPCRDTSAKQKRHNKTLQFPASNPNKNAIRGKELAVKGTQPRNRSYCKSTKEFSPSENNQLTNESQAILSQHSTLQSRLSTISKSQPKINQRSPRNQQPSSNQQPPLNSPPGPLAVLWADWL